MRQLLLIAIVSFFLAGCNASSTTRSSAGIAPTCTRNVVLTGYWPNTNEMLREWSPNAAQRTGPWRGANWRQHGFDVYAFFPEFKPDGNPMNDPFGSDGWVGSADSDLKVDYQATSADFWRLMDHYQPQILITTSRGGKIGWEIEALEGGHAGDGPTAAADWLADKHGDISLPTQASIEPRSWQAISQYREGRTVPSQLPVASILEATAHLGVATVAVDESGTSGNYLSGFIALHGLYYNLTNPNNLAAGHIHVGIDVSATDAQSLMQATLDAVLSEYDASSLPCTP